MTYKPKTASLPYYGESENGTSEEEGIQVEQLQEMQLKEKARG